MATFRDNYALVLDISQYNQKIDWDKLAKYTAMVWVRASVGIEGDKLVSTHIQNAYDHDVPAGLYFAIDPGYYVHACGGSIGFLKDLDRYLPLAKDETFQAFLHAATNKKYYAIAIDFERFTDWNGQVINDTWLNEMANQVVSRLCKTFPNTPIYFYSANWFMTYAPSIQNVAGLKNIGNNAGKVGCWSAFYPYAKGAQAVEWENLKSIYPPENLTFSDKSVHQNPPVFGFDTWKFWQWSGDKFQLPGMTDDLGRPSAVDLNFFNGTKEKLWKEIGFTPRTVPVTPPTTDPDPEPEDADLKTRVEALEAWKAEITQKFHNL